MISRISVDSSGNYSYDVEGTTLSRFKADVYGHSYIDDLTADEANASAQQMVEDMLKRYEIPYDHSDYKASELKKAQGSGTSGVADKRRNIEDYFGKICTFHNKFPKIYSGNDCNRCF